MAFRPVFSSSCSFLPIVLGRGFFVRYGQRVFNFGIAGWTVVEGFGLDGLRMAEGPLYPPTWDKDSCLFAPIETINKKDLKEKRRKERWWARLCSLSSTPPVTEISTPQESIVDSIRSTLQVTPGCLCLVKLSPSPPLLLSDSKGWRRCS